MNNPTGSLIDKLQERIDLNNRRSNPYDATGLMENRGLKYAIDIIRQHQAAPSQEVVERALRYAREIAPTREAVELYDKAIAALQPVMGDASTRKDEEDTAQATLITPPVVPSEISVVDEGIIAVIEKADHEGSKLYAAQPNSWNSCARHIFAAIRPYLRHEASKVAVSIKELAMNVPDDWNMMDVKDAMAILLDAAGVPYE